MKKRVLIIHGWGGSSFPHWQAHLASDLIKDNYIVSFPNLPTMDNPDIKEWKSFIKKEINHFKPQIVVCHSLGNILWFHIVKDLDISFEKLLLVAPVRKTCDIEEVKEFFPYEASKDLKAKEVQLLASTNDKYMNLDEVYALQKELDIPLKVFENAGHFNAESSYGKFDYAYDFVTSEAKV